MKDVIKFWFLYFCIILFACWLSSCSPEKRARMLVRQAYKKLEKAQTLDPSVVDTLKGKTTVTIDVPGDSAEYEVKPEVDTAALNHAVTNYDSMLLANDSLNRLIKSGNLTQFQLEQALSDQRRAADALKKQRDKFRNAFLRDSTYTYPDSLVDIDVIVEGGKVAGIRYKLHDRKVSKDVNTTTINLDGSRIVSPFKQTWFWVMLCLIVVLFLVILVLSKRK